MFSRTRLLAMKLFCIKKGAFPGTGPQVEVALMHSKRLGSAKTTMAYQTARLEIEFIENLGVGNSRYIC